MPYIINPVYENGSKTWDESTPQPADYYIWQDPSNDSSTWTSDDWAWADEQNRKAIQGNQGFNYNDPAAMQKAIADNYKKDYDFYIKQGYSEEQAAYYANMSTATYATNTGEDPTPYLKANQATVDAAVKQAADEKAALAKEAEDKAKKRAEQQKINRTNNVTVKMFQEQKVDQATAAMKDLTASIPRRDSKWKWRVGK